MATIYYWAWANGNVGHLSMALDNGTYISNWPEDSAKPLSSKMRGSPCPSLQEDIRLEEKEPDEILEIPKAMINIEKIQKYWDSMKKKGTTYQMMFSNCAQVVLEALRVGEIILYEPVDYDAVLFTPYDVLEYIKSCKEKYENPGVGGLFFYKN